MHTLYRILFIILVCLYLFSCEKKDDKPLYAYLNEIQFTPDTMLKSVKYYKYGELAFSDTYTYSDSLIGIYRENYFNTQDFYKYFYYMNKKAYADSLISYRLSKWGEVRNKYSYRFVYDFSGYEIEEYDNMGLLYDFHIENGNTVSIKERDGDWDSFTFYENINRFNFDNSPFLTNFSGRINNNLTKEWLHYFAYSQDTIRWKFDYVITIRVG